MIFVGVVLTGFGIKTYLEAKHFFDTSSSTTGTVVDLEINSEGLRKPVVSFTDKNGTNQVFKSRSATTELKYHVDDNVDVIYSLEMDESFLISDTRFLAFIDDDHSLFIQQWAILLFGVLFLVLGIVGAKIFWNRDSMSISVSSSWDLWSKKNNT